MVLDDLKRILKISEHLVSKDKEDIGQKDDGNKRVNKADDREDREKFQQVIKEVPGKK